MVRLMKVLHMLGSIGIMGGAAACVLLRTFGSTTPPDGFTALRHAIDAVFHWLLVPSMVVCILSGWVSMFVHRPYWNALWAWAKALSGMAVLQFTFRLQSLASSVTTPDVLNDPLELADVLRKEWSGLWVMLAVCLFNVVFGVWRPFRAFQNSLL
jgi:hypothetical protein